jgi:hypothetical protein
MVSLDVSIEVKEGRGRGRETFKLENDLNGQASLAELLAFTKRSLILIADAALREEQAKGFTKQPIVFVDGSKNKKAINVNPLGKIEFLDPQKFNNVDVLKETYRSILDKSPVLTGQYSQSNIVYFNNTPVARTLSEFDAWIKKAEIKSGDVIRFINVQPYARKLERLGVTRQRTTKITRASTDKRQRSGPRVLAPNGTYYLTYRSISRKYRKVKSIKFDFVPGSSLGLTGRFTSRANLRGSKEKQSGLGRTYLYPSIRIVL